MEGLIGALLIVGLFVAYAVQRRTAKRGVEPADAPPPEAEAAPVPRGSSPNWGAPIAFCGLLFAAATHRDSWWGWLWQGLYAALVALGAYTTLSSSEFAAEQGRGRSASRREHVIRFGVPYVLVPIVAWILCIPLGWNFAALLPAAPWALLALLGVGVALFGAVRK